MRLTVLALLAVVLAAGCAETRPATVAGAVEATAPTASALRVRLVTPDGDRVLAFERQAWYVAGLERELADLPRLAVTGAALLDGTVVVERVLEPDDVEARFRYAEDADPAERERLDAEWDARFEEALDEPGDLAWLERGGAALP